MRKLKTLVYQFGYKILSDYMFFFFQKKWNNLVTTVTENILYSKSITCEIKQAPSDFNKIDL